MIAPVFTLCIQGVEKRSTLSLPHITQQRRTSRSAKPSPLLAGNGSLESWAGPRADWRSTEIEVRSPPTASLPLQKGERCTVRSLTYVSGPSSPVNTRRFSLFPFSGRFLKKPLCQPFVNFTIGAVVGL